MQFNFFNPVRVITGEGCVQKNAAEFSKLGKSCLIVTSGSAAKKSGALNDALKALDKEGIKYMLFDEIEPNPTMVSCQKAGEIARANNLEFILGIGGGSPLDAAKAVAVYATNEMSDGLDIFKTDWKNPALPIAAIGTTAGTGSEVTRFSILTMPDGHKKSFGTDETYPTVMFGDARYTATLPLNFTASTALDALAHALEGYFNSVANALTDMFAIEAVAVLLPQLKHLRQAGDISDILMEQREQLYYASIIAGYTLSQCGTLYCHNLGYYLTENYDVPHGFACAATLPDLLRRGVRYAPDKAARLFQKAGTSADELCGLIESLTKIPPVKISAGIIENLAKSSEGSNNFKKTLPNGFTAGDAIELLTALFG